jgi:hypothetical protein
MSTDRDKLALRRQSIRTLTASELRIANGGVHQPLSYACGSDGPVSGSNGPVPASKGPTCFRVNSLPAATN